MTQKAYFILANAAIRSRVCETVQNAPEGYAVTIQEPNRTLEQNSAQWPILQEIADLKPWPVNGQMRHLQPEEWKDILTAAFKKETAQVAQGWDGGIVLLGHRTREFGKREFSDWIEFLHSVLAQVKAEVAT